MEYTEVLDKQITRKQHYVPKAYLRNFAIGSQNSEQVYVVFAKDEGAKRVSIDNICCRSYLYDQIAIDPDSKERIFVAPNEIENSFIQLEGEYASIISKIKNNLRSSDEFQLTWEEIDRLKQFMSSLMFRNPIFVHISNYIIATQFKNDKEYMELVKNAHPDVPQNVYLSVLANKFLKLYIDPDVGMLPWAMVDTMKESQMCILKAKGSVFVTSDTPVVNIYGEKDGMEYDLLGMPITPELFLAFVDTAQHIPQIVLVDDNSVKYINSKQVNKKMLISDREDLLASIDYSIDAEEKDNEQFYQLLHTDKETAFKQYKKMMRSKEIRYWD